MSEACGCHSREGHAEPHVDPVLHIAHGERDPDCDPGPHEVQSSGRWPDAYCLCGHPDYMTCEAWANGGGVAGLTLHNVGGHYLTTLPE